MRTLAVHQNDPVSDIKLTAPSRSIYFTCSPRALDKLILVNSRSDEPNAEDDPPA